jgi:hypothetical protein
MSETNYNGNDKNVSQYPNIFEEPVKTKAVVNILLYSFLDQKHQKQMVTDSCWKPNCHWLIKRERHFHIVS